MLTILLFSICPLSEIFADDAQNKDVQVSSTEKKAQNTAPQTLEEILNKLTKTTKELTSLQANIEYKFIQDPELFESTTTNLGKIFYQKTNQGSALRLSFQTRQEDDFEPEKYREEFIFDGIWLTRINFPLKQINMDQFATKNKPIEVFELISANLPLVGFSNIDKLEKDFEIKIIEQQTNKHIQLFMNTKKDSKYAENYKDMDFYIDNDSFLPIRIVSRTPQGDIYDIKFTFTKKDINKKLDNKIFMIEHPSGFDKNINRLKDTNMNPEKQKG